MKYTPSIRRLVVASVSLVIGILLIVGFWVVLGERLANKFLPDNPWPSLHAGDPADPALVHQFEDLINREDEVTGKAYTTFDLTDFPLIYIDDPAVSLSRDQAQYFAEIKASQTGINDLVKGEGWLSYSQATFLNLESGARASQIQATLAVQGRTMTADDYRKAGAAVPPAGVTPTAVPFIYGGYSNGYKFKVSFKSVTIEGDKAEVTYIKSDDGKTTHAFLVKTATGWRIAGIRRLPV